MVKLKRKKFKGSFIHATDYYSFSNSYETYAMNIRIKRRNAVFSMDQTKHFEFLV